VKEEIILFNNVVIIVLQVTSEDEPQVLCLKHAVEHIREKASPEGFRILSRHDTVSTRRLD